MDTNDIAIIWTTRDFEGEPNVVVFESIDDMPDRFIVGIERDGMYLRWRHGGEGRHPYRDVYLDAVIDNLNRLLDDDQTSSRRSKSTTGEKR